MVKTKTDQSKIQRKYNLNEDYFSTIDTEDKAYFLGFLYADGCVSTRDNYIQLALKEEDKEILEKLKSSISYGGPLLLQKRLGKNSFPNGQDRTVLAFSSKKVKTDLIEKGCTTKKTFTLSFPHESIVPKSLINHFIRGYFDGDGCVSYSLPEGSKTLSFEFNIIGTRNFLVDIQDILIENCDLNRTKISVHKTGMCYLRYRGNKNVKKICEYLYNNSNIFLQRKCSKFKMLN